MNNIIYCFIREDGTPFYIGKTNNFTRRKRRHLSNIKDKTNLLPKYHKARKLIAAGCSLDDIMVVKEKNLTPEEATQREIELIAEFRKTNIKLYNLTNGGEGCSNWTPEMHKAAVLKRTGRKCSEETRKKISKAHKGKKLTDKHKKNLSKAWQGRVVTKETRKKLSEGHKGKINIKKFKVIDPDGNEYITTNGLNQFCREHNLVASCLHKVANGERKHHKGWKMEKIEDEDNKKYTG